MDFEQRILLKHNNGLFEHCWLAATITKIKLKSTITDIAKINVATTCEKLYEGLIQWRKQRQKYLGEFRVMLKLYYGTLNIFEFQVNELFDASLQLLSCDLLQIKNYRGIKRKQCSSTIITQKKRQLSFFETTNYTQLYDESEHLLRWAESNKIYSMEEVNSTTLINNVVTQGSNFKCLQIREMTVYEINTDETSYLDMGNDFGIATNEEIKKFINFNNDNLRFGSQYSEINTTKQSKKNRMIPVMDIRNENRFDYEHSPIDNLLNVAISYESKSELKSSVCLETKANRFKSKANHIKNSSLQAHQHNCDQSDMRTTNLIMDNLRIISIRDIKKQIKTTQKQDQRKKLMQRITKTKLQNKFFNITSFTSSILKKTLYCPRSFTKEKISNDYQNIVRDILSNHYKSNSADEIYPKWGVLSSELKSRANRKRKNHEDLILKTFNIGQDLQDDNLNPTNYVGYNNTTNRNSNAHEKWSQWNPYNLFIKLMDVWRTSEKAEIDVKKVIMSTKSRVSGALIVHSLLASGTITLITQKNSIELIKIKCNYLSEELIANMRKEHLKI